MIRHFLVGCAFTSTLTLFAEQSTTTSSDSIATAFKQLCPTYCEANTDTLQLLRLEQAARELNDHALTAQLLNARAYVLIRLRQYERSQRLAYEALVLAETHNLIEDLGFGHLNLGDIALYMGDPELADKEYLLCIDALKTLKAPEQADIYWKCQDRLSVIDQIKGEFDQYFLRTRQIRQHYLAIGDSISFANSLLNGVIPTSELVHPDTALRDVFAVDALFKRQGNTLDRTYSLQAIGKAYSLKEDENQAIEYYNKAFELADTVGLSERALELIDMLEEAYLLAGDWKAAHEAKTEYARLKSLVLSEERQLAIERLRTELGTELKTLQLEKTKAEHAAEQRKARLLLLMLIAVAALALLGFFIYRQRLQLMARESLIKQQQMEQSLKKTETASMEAIIKSQENERERIGKELHDRIGSLLATVKLQFANLKQHISSSEDYEQRQKSAFVLLDEAMMEVRRISHDLASGLLADYGLAKSLEELQTTVNSIQGLQMDLHLYGLEVRLPGQLEIAMYRIVQELLSNVIRHSGANHIALSITRHEQLLSLSFEDNGKGFELRHGQEGIGLKNIKERLAAFGGELHIDSQVGRGSTFIIEVSTQKNVA